MRINDTPRVRDLLSRRIHHRSELKKIEKELAYNGIDFSRPNSASRAVLTEPQEKLYMFMLDYQKKNNHPPLSREMGSHMGWKHNNSVVTMMKALSIKGFISTSPTRHRRHTALSTPEVLRSQS